MTHPGLPSSSRSSRSSCFTVLHRALRAVRRHCGLALAVLATAAAVAAPLPAHAQSKASAALSLLPVASVVGAASAGSTAAGAVLAA